MAAVLFFKKKIQQLFEQSKKSLTNKFFYVSLIFEKCYLNYLKNSELKQIRRFLEV